MFFHDFIHTVLPLYRIYSNRILRNFQYFLKYIWYILFFSDKIYIDWFTVYLSIYGNYART